MSYICLISVLHFFWQFLISCIRVPVIQSLFSLTSSLIVLKLSDIFVEKIKQAQLLTLFFKNGVFEIFTTTLDVNNCAQTITQVAVDHVVNSRHVIKLSSFTEASWTFLLFRLQSHDTLESYTKASERLVVKAKCLQ